jgi:hypothetical protein
MAQFAEAQFGTPAIGAAGIAYDLSALFVTVNAFDPAVDIAPSTNEISHRVLSYGYRAWQRLGRRGWRSRRQAFGFGGGRDAGGAVEHRFPERACGFSQGKMLCAGTVYLLCGFGFDFLRRRGELA